MDAAAKPSDYINILRSAPDLYLVLTPDLNIFDVSDAYLKATMVERKHIVGRNIFDVFPDNPQETDATGVSNLSASLQRVLQEKIPDAMAVQKYPIRRPREAGGGFEERYWSPLNTPVLNEKHEIIYIIHRVEDVTWWVKQREIEEELRSSVGTMEWELYQRAQEIQEKNKKLREANKNLEAFNFMVSHDLRNPLQAIRGFSALLLKNYKLEPMVCDFVNEIQQSSEQMARLINDLFDFSRASRHVIKKEKINISEMAISLLEQLQKRFPGTNISWFVQENVNIVGDKDLLHIVLDNLLCNAWKYTSKTTNGHIHLDYDVNQNVISIHDNGVGFLPFEAESIFTPFTRLHSEDEFPGTGIGLATVKTIIERHEGRVWAISQGKNQGATFYFTLPSVAGSSSPRAPR